jgi:integrase
MSANRMLASAVPAVAGSGSELRIRTGQPSRPRPFAGFVLHRDGEPVRHGTFNGWWVRARDGAELGGMRFHDLQHGFASALISSGCSVKAVQRALGSRLGVDHARRLRAPLAGR